MRAVIQRVSSASVKIGSETAGGIGQGLLVLLAVHVDDTPRDIDWLAKKIVQLRIFEDSESKMNKSVKEIGGSVLVVSQFTLYGDCKKGNRPSFIKSAEPVKANDYYEKFVAQVKAMNMPVQTGRFQEHMQVSLVNDGPTTIIIDSRN